MTRLDSLIALRDAVRPGGVFPDDRSARDLGLTGDYDGLPIIVTMYAAFSGSFDASQALFNVLLPGWWWRGDDGQMQDCPFIRITKFGGGKRDFFEGEGDNPAQALFVAILSALIAKEAGE